MQLFICPRFRISGAQMLIQDAWELVLQLRKVLRAQKGYECFVQSEKAEERFHIALENWTDKEITAQILERIPAPQQRKKVWMLIALPNKQEKLELIVQKLTEIWISSLFFWASERSVLKSLNENKIARLHKIVKEAAEQSWSWEIPSFHLVENMKSLAQEWSFVIFDLPQTGSQLWVNDIQKSDLPFLGVIWPEGGLTSNDYHSFGEQMQVVSLGEQVLRMETAAIISAWNLKNIS